MPPTTRDQSPQESDQKQQMRQANKRGHAGRQAPSQVSYVRAPTRTSSCRDAHKSALPPPGTIPSDTAARVALRASTKRSFFSPTSTSELPPTWTRQDKNKTGKQAVCSSTTPQLNAPSDHRTGCNTTRMSHHTTPYHTTTGLNQVNQGGQASAVHHKTTSRGRVQQCIGELVQTFVRSFGRANYLSQRRSAPTCKVYTYAVSISYIRKRLNILVLQRNGLGGLVQLFIPPPSEVQQC